MERVTVRMARSDRRTPWGFGVTEAPDRSVVIVNVVGGSLADRAGLRNGDVVDRLEDLGDLDINAVDRLLVTAHDKIELVVHRNPSGPARIWRPEVTENVGGGDDRPYRVNLQHSNDTRPPQGFNSSALPFETDPRVKHMQYNSPLGLYSDQTAAEQYVQQTAGYVDNASAKSSTQARDQPAYMRSEALRLLKEEEQSRQVGPGTTLSNHPNPNGLPVCFICGRPILGVMARAAGKDLHGDCLSCATCGNTLRNVGHHFIDEKFYCDIHGSQKKLGGRPGVDPNVFAKSSPTAAQPMRPIESPKAAYQPSVMATRPLSVSPSPGGTTVVTHYHTPKTQGILSPGQRGVPTAAFGADLSRTATYGAGGVGGTAYGTGGGAGGAAGGYSPAPSSAAVRQVNVQSTNSTSYAAPPPPSNPPPQANLANDGVGGSSRVPTSLRDAVSPRKGKAPRQWPPPLAPVKGRYWQIDPAGQMRKERPRSPETLQEMIRDCANDVEPGVVHEKKPNTTATSRRSQRRMSHISKEQVQQSFRELATRHEQQQQQPQAMEMVRQPEAAATSTTTPVVSESVTLNVSVQAPKPPEIVDGKIHWTVIHSPQRSPSDSPALKPIPVPTTNKPEPEMQRPIAVMPIAEVPSSAAASLKSPIEISRTAIPKPFRSGEVPPVVVRSVSMGAVNPKVTITKKVDMRLPNEPLKTTPKTTSDGGLLAAPHVETADSSTSPIPSIRLLRRRDSHESEPQPPPNTPSAHNVRAPLTASPVPFPSLIRHQQQQRQLEREHDQVKEDVQQLEQRHEHQQQEQERVQLLHEQKRIERQKQEEKVDQLQQERRRIQLQQEQERFQLQKLEEERDQLQQERQRIQRRQEEERLQREKLEEERVQLQQEQQRVQRMQEEERLHREKLEEERDQLQLEQQRVLLQQEQQRVQRQQEHARVQRQKLEEERDQLQQERQRLQRQQKSLMQQPTMGRPQYSDDHNQYPTQRPQPHGPTHVRVYQHQQQRDSPLPTINVERNSSADDEDTAESVVVRPTVQKATSLDDDDAPKQLPKILKRVDFSRATVIPNPTSPDLKWTDHADIVDESDILTERDEDSISLPHFDDRTSEFLRVGGGGVVYDGDESEVQDNKSDVASTLDMDDDGDWRLPVSSSTAPLLPTTATTSTTKRRRHADVDVDEKQWRQRAMELLEDDAQTERDLLIVAALNERLQGLREMEDEDRLRAIECIARHQSDLEQTQTQLSNLLESAIVYLQNFGAPLPGQLLGLGVEPDGGDADVDVGDDDVEPDELRPPPAPPQRRYFAPQVRTDSFLDVLDEWESIGLAPRPGPSTPSAVAVQPPSAVEMSKKFLAERLGRQMLRDADVDVVDVAHTNQTNRNENDGRGPFFGGSYTKTVTETTTESHRPYGSGSGQEVRGTGSLTTATQHQGGRIPFCDSCKQQIRGAFVLATGKAWCPEHFVCANRECGRRLLECGFVEERGEKFCEGCFERHIAPRCAKCAKPIVSDCLNALQKKWHPTCFTCAHCQKPFGNSAFYLEQGLPYCERDWNALFTTKCVSCSYPIEAGDRWVEALGSAFHSNCFTCARCHHNLEGESFFAKNGQPFCKLHA